MHISPYATPWNCLDALISRYGKILVIGYELKRLLIIPPLICDLHLNLREVFGELG